MKKGKVFIISAPSGSGKTTVVSKVLKTLKNIKRSISVTTRNPREGEKKNKDYIFVSEKVFRNKCVKKEFVEWAKNFGYYYGTLRKNVESQLEKGIDVILTIDVKGAIQVRKKIPDSVLIFIMPPSLKDLTNRLKKRATEKDKEIKKRLKIAEKEIKQSKKYDYIIINDVLSKAVRELKSIITAKRCEKN